MWRKQKLSKVFLSVLICAGLLTLAAIVVSRHPILLKAAIGQARWLRRYTGAEVYLNEKRQNSIRIYTTDYLLKDSVIRGLLIFPLPDAPGRLNMIYINLTEKYVGIPVGRSQMDYDLILGCLFQSETGGKFIPIQSDIKGAGQHYVINEQSSFVTVRLLNADPKWGFDSLKIVKHR